LPVDITTPQLIYVGPFFWVSHGSYQSRPDLEPLLNSENLSENRYPGLEYIPINYNAKRGHALDHKIYAAIREKGLTDGSSLNACIKDLTKGKGKFPWPGPIFGASHARNETYR